MKEYRARGTKKNHDVNEDEDQMMMMNNGMKVKFFLGS